MKDTQNTTLPQETRSAAQPQDGQPENGKKTGKTPAKRELSARYLAKVGIFAALAYVLYLFPKISLAVIFPSWLELNFSDIPALIGTFALGPWGGAAIVAVKILLKLPLSQTGFSGEFADLLCGLALVLPAGFIYKYHRTFKGAVLAMAAGSLCATLAAVFTNRFIVVPWYVNLMGGWEPILAMIRPIFAGITEQNFYTYYLWLSVVPFNLLRCFIASLVTALLYKRISRLLAKF